MKRRRPTLIGLVVVTLWAAITGFTLIGLGLLLLPLAGWWVPTCAFVAGMALLTAPIAEVVLS